MHVAVSFGANEVGSPEHSTPPTVPDPVNESSDNEYDVNVTSPSLVTKNEYVVHVSGGKVGVEEPRGPSRIDDSVDTRAWFDEKGTLTLPDNETGETLVSISCKELRQAASLDTPEWINDFPPGQLWTSPDGIAWSQQQVTREFGRGSYVYSTAVNGDTFAALVVPNGDRPIDDPPNCPLNLYPAERPYEIWIASASE